MLQMMEDCLCSGDGLSPQSAFKVKDERVVEKVLGVLGLKGKVERGRHEASVTAVPVDDNVMGVKEMFFTLP